MDRRMIRIPKLLAALFLLALVAVAPALAQFQDQRNWASTVGGTANAITATIANFPATPPTGVPLRGLATANNTGPTTLNISGSGVKNVFKPSASGAVALVGGEIVIGQMFEVVYDGTQYQLTSNNAQSATIRTLPQGYLTPCNFANSPSVTGCTAGQMVPSASVTSVAALYYGTWFGNQVPIYNGVNMVQTTFTELTLTIPSSRLANTIYDVCIFNDAGTIRAGFGPAWTTSTAGSGARGTGAGTPQITQVQGIWVNAVAISAVNGASTYSVSANQCTYVATVLIDGTNGQVTFTQTAGQSRKWAAWNAWNRQTINLQILDNTASWSYSSATLRPMNNNAANSATVLSGLADDRVMIDFSQNMDISNASGYSGNAFGWNSTTSAFGYSPTVGTVGSGTPSLWQRTVGSPLPSIGSNVVTPLERASGSASTFKGGDGNMFMLVQFRG